ncbi:MAG TPA: glycosyltransferase family 2 protein [Steroidobacteraceae bacterium]|nr:glycosyltransferase family 2 protein [Steroidobacteraceae bacterium]
MDVPQRMTDPSGLGTLPAPPEPHAGVTEPGPQLSVIVPTFNERANVAEVVERLRGTLAGRRWEVIFVDDDSPDGTGDAVRAIAAGDHRVRCLARLGRRGLASACIEGMLASSAPYLAVMDADLQHDETLLPRMWDLMLESGADIVIGSRYAAGGGIGGWQRSRATLSRYATWLSRLVIRAQLTDPMSGFFMLRRPVLEECVRGLSALGFKILVDLFASAPRPLEFRELPYQFRPRRAGQSKLDSLVAWDFGLLLIDKLVGHIVPVRFIAFTLVGAFGFLVHFAVLAVLIGAFSQAFVRSQAIATVVAMTFNYSVNNALTYRDRRLTGWGWLRGWAAFVAACSVGAVANVGIASYVYHMRRAWVPAAAAGVLVGAVWNYAATLVFTWSKPGGRT